MNSGLHIYEGSTLGAKNIISSNPLKLTSSKT